MLRPRGRPFPNPPPHHRCCQTLVAGECPLNLKTRRKRSREFASGRENGEGTNEETNGTNLSATSVRINGHERSESSCGRTDGQTGWRADECTCPCPSSPLMAPNLTRLIITCCGLPERPERSLNLMQIQYFLSVFNCPWKSKVSFNLTLTMNV